MIEMSDVDRRRILTFIVSGLTGYLTDPPPAGELRLGTEPLDRIAQQLDELRLLDREHGAARILVPATWTAERLVRLLNRTTSASSLYQRLAELTTDAALLARWAAFETGNPREALHWCEVAARVATAAGSPDLVALAAGARADTLSAGLDDQRQARAALDQVPIRVVAPPIRAYIELTRGRVLASAGEEAASLRALDRAAAGADGTGDGLPFNVALNVEHARGFALLKLGYGEAAQRALSGALRQQDASRVRSTGTIRLLMAEAAVSMDEPKRAAGLLVRAHRALAGTRSVRRLGELDRVAGELYARFGQVRAVQELREQLRQDATPAGADTHRYRLARSSTSRQRPRLHQADCSYLRRFRRSESWGWPEGDALAPEEVVANADVRARFELCGRCLPPAPNLPRQLREGLGDLDPGVGG